MNSTDASRINDAAPDVYNSSMRDDNFCDIMELTKEEKRELISLWRAYNGKKS